MRFKALLRKTYSLTCYYVKARREACRGLYVDILSGFGLAQEKQRLLCRKEVIKMADNTGFTIMNLNKNLDGDLRMINEELRVRNAIDALAMAMNHNLITENTYQEEVKSIYKRYFGEKGLIK